MNTRFYNAKICTMQEGRSVIEGELHVAGNRIAYIGPDTKSDLNFSREIDVGGNLLLPGFKNAHTHSAMTFLRSSADDLPLLQWLHQQVFPFEAQLAPDDVYQLSRLAIMEYLTSGITANFDMYFFPDMVAQASIDCGFRTVMCGATSGMEHEQQELDRLEQQYLKFNGGHGLITGRLGFHAEYTCSVKLLEGIAALSEKYKAPVYTHSSESAAETEQCIERHGKTPTALFESLGLFKHGGGCFHGVHLTDADMEILRKNNVAVITNPGSNAKLASGIAPVKQLMDLGVPLAIGTDGPASNNCLDFFREMFLTTALQKLREQDASVVDADRVLHMATVGGARVMGLDDCDVLAPGKLADLIMMDLQQPNMQPVNNLTKNIVYSGSKQNVKLVMIDGAVRYEDGRFDIGVEPAEVYAKANEIIRRMK